MPRPNLPPTPGSSTDIKGRDGTPSLTSLHMSFELPPPAMHDAARVSPEDSKQHPHQQPSPTSPSNSAYPMQAAETVKARRRSSAAQGKESGFALPPPPTRSRKIIQMQPPSEEHVDSEAPSTAASSKGKGGKAAAQATKANPKDNLAGSGAAAQQQGKKKQPSATSAAGRKIARKTAHSLIERRRRSKMNEEFGVLKGLIPACTGDMHKLAILQASIEYIRYLEDCVGKLKAQHDDEHSRAQLPSIREFHPTFQSNDDIEMTDSEAVSPTFTAQPDSHQQPFQNYQPIPSPALQAQDRGRQQSYSSVSTAADHQRHYSYSGGASPAFGPQGGYAPSNAGSALTSPALNPQSDLDQEATAALLMLNNDRRGYANASSGGRNASGRRAVSVKDLLTS